MTNKDPDVYQQIWTFFQEFFRDNREVLILAAISGFVSVAKMCKEGKVSRYWVGFFEMLLCATFAGVMFPVMHMFDVDNELGRVIAIGIGWFGSDAIMGWLINAVRSHLGVKLSHVINYTANEKAKRNNEK